MKLERLLGSIGKRVFVQYFQEFGNSSISNQEMIALLQKKEAFTLKACTSRTYHARRIFRDGLNEQALSIIAKSAGLKQEVADEARALLAQLCRRPASSALKHDQQSMKIIETIELAVLNAAKERKKMSTFHSQVLLHAKLLEDLDPYEFCRAVGVPATYHIEFRKMIAVAQTLSELGFSIQKR